MAMRVCAKHPCEWIHPNDGAAMSHIDSYSLKLLRGASLKHDAVVHRVYGLEEVRRTRNSHWHRHPPLRWNECLW